MRDLGIFFRSVNSFFECKVRVFGPHDPADNGMMITAEILNKNQCMHNDVNQADKLSVNILHKIGRWVHE